MMNRNKNIFALTIALIAFVFPVIGQNPPSQESSAQSATKADQTVKQSFAINTAEGNQGKDPVEAPPPIGNGMVIIVIDTSPSVRKYLREIKLLGKELIASAPSGMRTGVVGINWEATKMSFSDPAEANKFIDGLQIGGRYTDLARGNDAALSMLGDGQRTAIVFLTDGAAEVPAGFKNKETFIEILRREYTPRANVRVFIVNVKGTPLAGIQTLPPNVTVFSLADWQAARGLITKTLSPQIKAQLSPEQPAPETPAANSPQNPKVERSGRITLFAAIFGSLILGSILAFFYWYARRRAARSDDETNLPENILREADLNAVAPPTPTEPILMIQAEKRGQINQLGEPLRAIVHVGESLSLGNSRFLADFELPGLKQTQTLQVTFTGGESAQVVRLRPRDSETLDMVQLNKEVAPVRFAWQSGEDIDIGDYRIEMILTEETALQFIDTSRRTETVMIGAGTENPLRRLRRRAP